MSLNPSDLCKSCVNCNSYILKDAMGYEITEYCCTKLIGVTSKMDMVVNCSCYVKVISKKEMELMKGSVDGKQ